MGTKSFFKLIKYKSPEFLQSSCGPDNMQRRAKELQGKLSAESTVNTGTTTKLAVPVS